MTSTVHYRANNTTNTTNTNNNVYELKKSDEYSPSICVCQWMNDVLCEYMHFNMVFPCVKHLNYTGCTVLCVSYETLLTNDHGDNNNNVETSFNTMIDEIMWRVDCVFNKRVLYDGRWISGFVMLRQQQQMINVFMCVVKRLTATDTTTTDADDRVLYDHFPKLLALFDYLLVNVSKLIGMTSASQHQWCISLLDHLQAQIVRTSLTLLQPHCVGGVLQRAWRNRNTQDFHSVDDGKWSAMAKWHSMVLDWMIRGVLDSRNDWFRGYCAQLLKLLLMLSMVCPSHMALSNSTVKKNVSASLLHELMCASQRTFGFYDILHDAVSTLLASVIPTLPGVERSPHNCLLVAEMWKYSDQSGVNLPPVDTFVCNGVWYALLGVIFPLDQMRSRYHLRSSTHCRRSVWHVVELLVAAGHMCSSRISTVSTVARVSWLQCLCVSNRGSTRVGNDKYVDEDEDPNMGSVVRSGLHDSQTFSCVNRIICKLWEHMRSENPKVYSSEFPNWIASHPLSSAPTPASKSCVCRNLLSRLWHQYLCDVVRIKGVRGSSVTVNRLMSAFARLLPRQQLGTTSEPLNKQLDEVVDFVWPLIVLGMWLPPTQLTSHCQRLSKLIDGSQASAPMKCVVATGAFLLHRVLVVRPYYLHLVENGHVMTWVDMDLTESVNVDADVGIWGELSTSGEEEGSSIGVVRECARELDHALCTSVPGLLKVWTHNTLNNHDAVMTSVLANGLASLWRNVVASIPVFSSTRVETEAHRVLYAFMLHWCGSFPYSWLSPVLHIMLPALIGSRTLRNTDVGGGLLRVLQCCIIGAHTSRVDPSEERDGPEPDDFDSVLLTFDMDAAIAMHRTQLNSSVPHANEVPSSKRMRISGGRETISEWRRSSEGKMGACIRDGGVVDKVEKLICACFSPDEALLSPSSHVKCMIDTLCEIHCLLGRLDGHMIVWERIWKSLGPSGTMVPAHNYHQTTLVEYGDQQRCVVYQYQIPLIYFDTLLNITRDRNTLCRFFWSNGGDSARVCACCGTRMHAGYGISDENVVGLLNVILRELLPSSVSVIPKRSVTSLSSSTTSARTLSFGVVSPFDRRVSGASNSPSTSSPVSSSTQWHNTVVRRVVDCVFKLPVVRQHFRQISLSMGTHHEPLKSFEALLVAIDKCDSELNAHHGNHSLCCALSGCDVLLMRHGDYVAQLCTVNERYGQNYRKYVRDCYKTLEYIFSRCMRLLVFYEDHECALSRFPPLRLSNVLQTFYLQRSLDLSVSNGQSLLFWREASVPHRHAIDTIPILLENLISACSSGVESSSPEWAVEKTMSYLAPIISVFFTKHHELNAWVDGILRAPPSIIWSVVNVWCTFIWHMISEAYDASSSWNSSSRRALNGGVPHSTRLVYMTVELIKRIVCCVDLPQVSHEVFKPLWRALQALISCRATHTFLKVLKGPAYGACVSLLGVPCVPKEWWIQCARFVVDCIGYDFVIQVNQHANTWTSTQCGAVAIPAARFAANNDINACARGCIGCEARHQLSKRTYSEHMLRAAHEIRWVPSVVETHTLSSSASANVMEVVAASIPRDLLETSPDESMRAHLRNALYDMINALHGHIKGTNICVRAYKSLLVSSLGDEGSRAFLLDLNA